MILFLKLNQFINQVRKNNMNTNKENFLKLVSIEKTDSMKFIKHRIRFRKFYKIYHVILNYLILRDKF